MKTSKTLTFERTLSLHGALCLLLNLAALRVHAISAYVFRASSAISKNSNFLELSVLEVSCAS